MMDTWHDFYRNEPITEDLTPEEAARILGGEGCMWAEQVDDQSLDERLWPRASAIAERLWSPREVRVVELADVRLNRFRCVLARRGIRASPISPSPPCVLP